MNARFRQHRLSLIVRSSARSEEGGSSPRSSSVCRPREESRESSRTACGCFERSREFFLFLRLLSSPPRSPSSSPVLLRLPLPASPALLPPSAHARRAPHALPLPHPQLPRLSPPPVHLLTHRPLHHKMSNSSHAPPKQDDGKPQGQQSNPLNYERGQFDEMLDREGDALRKVRPLLLLSLLPSAS